MLRTLTISAVLSVCPLLAQQGGGPVDAGLREAWSECQAAEASFHVASAKADRILREGRGDPELRQRYIEMTAEPQRAMREARQEFFRVFAEADRAGLDPKADRGLLLAGLYGAGRDLVESRPGRAADMFQELLRLYPDTVEAKDAAANWLYVAQVGLGQWEEAIATYRGLVAAAGDTERSLLQVRLGDLQAAAGWLEEAQHCYQQAGDEFPAELGVADPRQRALGLITQRLALVGLRAPELDVQRWVGGQVDGLRGQVVVLGFGATYSEPSRAAMPSLDDLRRQTGATVIGVTRVFADGYLPADRGQLLAGGEEVKEMDAQRFGRHLTEFHAKAELSFPFAVVSEGVFDSFRVRAIPTTVVLDPKGNVVLVTSGAAARAMTAAVVKRLTAAD